MKMSGIIIVFVWLGILIALLNNVLEDIRSCYYDLAFVGMLACGVWLAITFLVVGG